MASKASSVVMRASVLEKKMHYPVMTEKQIAARWKISLKTLRRWRLDGEGPVWHKLFHQVRYHEADIIGFERESAQHWMAILGDGERVPRVVTRPPRVADDAPAPETAEPEIQYVSAKDVIEATQLPAHLFTVRDERYRRRIPHLLLVGNLRFSLDAILQWELANSIRGSTNKDLILPPATPEPVPEPLRPARVPRWYELVGEQERERFDSPQ